MLPPAEETPRAKLGIAFKLVIIACAAVFASCLTVGVLLHRSYIDSLNKIEMERLVGKAEDTTTQFNLALATARSSAVSMARLPMIDAYLRSLDSPDNTFDGASEEIWFQRASGRLRTELLANRLISSVTIVRLDDSREVLKIERRDRVIRTEPRTALGIRENFGPISLPRPRPGEPPPIVPLALRFPPDRPPVLEGFAPIMSPQRRMQAVLLFQIEPRRISTSMQAQRSTHDRMFLVDFESGATIPAHHPSDPPAAPVTPLNFYEEFPALKAAFSPDAPPKSGFFANAEGQTHALSLGYVSLSPRDNTALMIAFTENIQELVKSTAIAPANAILAGGTILAISLIVVWLFAINLTGPLREIAKAARLYGETNAAVPLPVDAESEVGDVARAFHAMQTQVEQRAEAHRREIEAHKRTEVSLAVAMEDAKKASSAKSSFLATMSHEIRTPMNGVIGMADLLSQTNLDQEQRELLSTITSSGENLLAIINDILDFSKIESGKMELEQHELSPVLCIEEVMDLLYPRIDEKGLEAIISIDPQVPRAILGDVTRIRQILTNLVGNAIKFTREGEIEARLDLIEQEGDTATLGFSVRDTGIGIPPEKREHLFAAFSQLDSSTTRQYGGTGLGLAICSRLVRLMGGRIQIDGAKGGGSIFHFTIKTPIVALEPSPAERHAIESLNGKRALIIDPSAAHAAATVRTLTGWGMACEVANSFREAGAALDKGEFGLVISNRIQIPHIGTLFHRCNPNASDAAVPFVCFVSRDDSKRVLNNRATTALRFLPKPMTRRRLIQSIARLGDPAIPIEPLPTEQKPALSHAHPLRILIVDDNQTNLHCALEILRRLGYEPDLARNGAEALELSRQTAYDLIFMDMRMPQMDGPEAVRQIRAQQGDRPRPRIVAFTANAMTEDRATCLASGMDGFIAKPARIAAFRAAIMDTAAAGA